MRLVAIACIAAMPLFAQAASPSASHKKVWTDATRLAAILSDTQDQRITISPAVWKVTANEANMLANRIFAASGGNAQARDLRTHVRQFRDAALKGDADGARSHAALALPFAYQLIE